MSDFTLVALEPTDAPSLQALADAGSRNVAPDEYARFLALEGAGGWLLREGGNVLGAVTTLRCFDHGIVGPLLAREGLAASLEVVLLSHAVESLQRAGVSRIEVEAAPREADILSHMGFERVRSTLVLERAPALRENADWLVRMEARHFLDVGALDGAAVGHGRKEFLLSAQEANPDGAFVVEEEGDVQGYAFLRRSRRGYHLGPLVTAAPTVEIAERLVRVAVSRVATWPVVVLVPDGSPLLPMLEREGFAPVGTLTRLRGGEKAPEPTAHEWLVGSRMTG